MNPKYFYSNGKLMITGEYLALAGSLVLAVPVRFGQRMEIKARPEKEGINISWLAMEGEKEWYRDFFTGNDFKAGNPKNPVSRKVQLMLQEARNLNPDFPGFGLNFQVSTVTDFPQEWGLGSSSALVSNLAWWVEADPFELFFRTQDGSGYDVACARSNKPLIYRFNGKQNQPSIHYLDFNPPFSENLWFVYTGKKQSSAESIRNINPADFDAQALEKISELTLKIAKEENLDHFMHLMTAHETVISRAIQQEPLQAWRFTGFPGAIKSLGAWGGDFCLAASDQGESKVRAYFSEKGCPVVFSFSEMILKNTLSNEN